MPKCVVTVVATVIAVAGGAFSRADDWPQWRGVNRDGLSSESGLLQEWPAAGPPQLWMRDDIGSGFSAAAAVGDRLFLMTNDNLEDEFIRSLSAIDGKTLWSVRVGRVGANEAPAHPGARSTPTVVGDWIYALGSDGDLICLRRDNGHIRWQLNLRTTFNGRPGKWAYAESPRVDDGRVIVTPGGADATVVALDAATGAVRWKTAVPGGDRAAYSSWSLAVVDGQRVYVQFVEGGLIGVDAESGAFLWRYDRVNRNQAKTTTAVTRGDRIYAANPPIGGAVLRLQRTATGVQVHEMYNLRGLPNSIGGSVLVNGILYGTTADGLVAADFETGAIKWRDPSVGPASVLYADGRLYLHGEGGEVALVDASPDAYRERGRFMPQKRVPRQGDQAWVYPVLSNGRLFIREHGTLWAFDVRGSGPGSRTRRE